MDNKMKTILGMCDHTLLKQRATSDDIFETCEDALKFGCKTVCIPPCYVKFARENFPDLAICTVIGFPNGNSTTAVKCFEAATAVAEGADEIDMVINIGMFKAGHIPDVIDEINAVKRACAGKTLKVIIETCLLNEQEKETACKVVNITNADFIKTSTGFSTGGATVEDIELMAKYCPDKSVKAAGGISSFEDAEKMLEAGACRLGTSRLVKIAKEGIYYDVVLSLWTLDESTRLDAQLLVGGLKTLDEAIVIANKYSKENYTEGDILHAIDIEEHDIDGSIRCLY